MKRSCSSWRMQKKDHHQELQMLQQKVQGLLKKFKEKNDHIEQLNKDHEETLQQLQDKVMNEQQHHQELQRQVQVLKQQIKGRNTYLEQLKKTS